jgi:hypothetical protein
MVMRTDPRTGQPLEAIEAPKPTALSAWASVIVLSIGVVVAGWCMLARGQFSQDPMAANALLDSHQPAPAR